MGKVIIKKVEIEDIESLRQIGRQTFDETFAPHNPKEHLNVYIERAFTLDQLMTELKNRNSQFYFAIIDETVVGYLKINIGDAQTELRKSESIEIERIYVLHKYQRMKIGQKLFNQAIEIAKEMNKKIVWLGVWEHNIKALNFYKKLGFVEFDKHAFKLGPDTQTDLLLKLEL